MPLTYPAGLSEFQKFQYAQTLAGVQLGREQWPELLYQDTTQTFTAATQPIIPDYINLNRPLGDLYVNFKGRIGVTVAGFTTASPDAPQNLLQNFKLYGNHRTFNQQQPWNISGATAFLLGRISQAQGGSLAIVNDSKASEPGIPQTTGVGLTSTGNYDMDLWWHFPMYPMIGQGRDAKVQQLPYFLNGDDWGNSLKVQWSWGDKTALGNPTGATVAWSAYGSAAGNPTISLYGNYAINGDFIGELGPPGLVIRNENFLNTFTAVTSQQVNLFALQQSPTTNIIVRSGVLQTGTSANVQTYASLSDRLLDQTSVFIDNKPGGRNNLSNMSYKAMAAGKLNTVWPQGTFCIPYDEMQSILNGYRFDTLSPSVQIWLRSQILTASAQNQISVVQEMIYGGPFGR